MSKMKLLAQTREKMKKAKYAPATIEVYIKWMVRYIHFHNLTHPGQLTLSHIDQFITHLAADLHYSATSQNQALDAIRYLYRAVLNIEFDEARVNSLRAKIPKSLPDTASHEDINRVVSFLAPRYRLIALLIYGAGLTLSECVTLKTHQINPPDLTITLKNRQTILPQIIVADIEEQIRLAHQSAGNVDNYLFPSSRLHSGRCYHISPSNFQKAIDGANRRVGMESHITARVLRHSFALHLLQDNYDVRTVQALLGHQDVRNTMIYQRLLDTKHVRSPLDNLRIDMGNM